MMDGKILDGITVLDLTQWVTGGFATLMLANQGADVIKVERPEVGDDIRHSGPPFIEGESPYYWTVSYGKKSIELDLKSDRGREIIYDIAEDADVVIENFRPGKVADLGVDYESIKAVNENIVYCSISAFGQEGPLSNRAGYDLLIQGMSGIMSVTGPEGGHPVKVGVALTDLITGMWAGFGVTMGLLKRERTGEGEYLELGMLDAAIPWLTKQAGKIFAGMETERMGTRDPLHAPYQTFEAEDGYINIACGNQQNFELLCEAIDRKDLVESERFASNPDRVEHMDELEEELERTFTTRPVDHWVELLADEYGLPAGPLQDIEEAMNHRQVQHRDIIQQMDHPTAGPQPVIDHPIKYEEADHGFDSHAPLLGQHTRDVLRSHGYDDDEIDRLLSDGVVSETGLQDE